MNLLFVCRHNQMRSRTAEAVYAAGGLHNVQSAGIARSAKVKLTADLVQWADMIFVMEEEQEEYIRENFPDAIGHREIIILDIGDHYYFMEPALVDLLKERIDPHLEP
jgi:protein-tyrosine phosphatase